MRHQNTFFHTILILLLAGLAGWALLSPPPPQGVIPQLRLGLDLQGGTQLEYEADVSGVPEADREHALQGARDVIERRVNMFGVSEPRVTTAGGLTQGRIVVEMPGLDDPDEAVRQIGETPLLEFFELEEEVENSEEEVREEVSEFEQSWIQTGLSGRHLDSARPDFDPTSGAPLIRLTFDREGRELFADITKRNIGKPVGIFLDGQPVTVPIVQQEILDGQAVITGQFTVQEARETAIQLNAGALPIPISLISRTTIGPTLGQVSFVQSIVAAVIGLSGMMLYMMALYRLPGVVAACALCIYGILTLAVYRIAGVTMTLAGIAGFILSLGIAVDANILIFERLREQLRLGKSNESSLKDGFRFAWPSIRDGNFSTLIICVLLWWQGTSVVQGFAFTLGIGIFISMFTAIFVTRTFLNILLVYIKSSRFFIISERKTTT